MLGPLELTLPMWRDILRDFPRPLTFLPPAEFAALAVVEATLGVSLPTDLRFLLTETDGVKDEYGCWLLWSVERIRAENLAFRTHAHFRELYMPFDHLLFFADDGCGYYYGFPVCAVGTIRHSEVFLWGPVEDSRTLIAVSFQA